MREALKVALRRSEVRQRLNEIGGLSGDDLTTEVKAELDTLTAEYSELEIRGRALAVAEDAEAHERQTEGSKTDTEYRKLVDSASVGKIFEAVVEHRATDGAEKEIQEEHGLSGNQVPLDLLVETRAVTPAPANVGQTQSAIIPAVFPQAAASFLGIDMPRVGVGEAVFPVLTTSAVAGTPAEGAPQAETTGAFSADVLSPARIQASFFYSREDRARFAGMAEALRENLNMALSDKLDQVIINGPNGLFQGNNLMGATVSAITDFAAYLNLLGYSRVDGTYASGTGDLRVLMGAATYAHAGAAYRNASTDRNVLDRLGEITAGVRVSAHVPAVTGNKQFALVRRGMRRDAVAPLWEGVTVLADEITKAATGEIVVTAVMLYAFKILRAAGFGKQETQHA